MKKIFIIGGAGFIGSHCAISLTKNGFTPIIIDNFSNSNQSIIKKLEKKGLKIYNLGTGKGSSVLEVIHAFKKQTGISIPYKFLKRREGDLAKFFCNPKKALKELNWRTKYELNQTMLDIKKIF